MPVSACDDSNAICKRCLGHSPEPSELPTNISLFQTNVMTGTTPVVLILPAIPFSNNHQETLKEKKVYYWPWNLQGMPGAHREVGGGREIERDTERAHIGLGFYFH